MTDFSSRSLAGSGGRNSSSSGVATISKETPIEIVFFSDVLQDDEIEEQQLLLLSLLLGIEESRSTRGMIMIRSSRFRMKCWQLFFLMW